MNTGKNSMDHGLPERSKNSGFTVIELMIAITILGVLLSLAAPSFQRLMTSTRLTSQANSLVADLSRARNEAAARNRPVRVCIAATPTTCAKNGNNWAAGWIIWADANGNDAVDAGEIIKSAPALEGGGALIASGPATLTNLTYQPYGGLGSSAATWTFTLNAPGDPLGRQITVPVTGRPSAKRIWG